MTARETNGCGGERREQDRWADTELQGRIFVVSLFKLSIHVADSNAKYWH